MKNVAKVMGVGMVKFAKPGSSDPYEVMAGKADPRRSRRRRHRL